MLWEKYKINEKEAGIWPYLKNNSELSGSVAKLAEWSLPTPEIYSSNSTWWSFHPFAIVIPLSNFEPIDLYLDDKN